MTIEEATQIYYEKIISLKKIKENSINGEVLTRDTEDAIKELQANIEKALIEEEKQCTKN